jgi:microcystin-dependent protein
MTAFVGGKWAETTQVNAANLNSATVPVGGIIMYSGVIADLPTNWKLCNGTSGTPDVRGRFIVGAEGSYAQGATGGAETVTLTSAQMPAHTHTDGTLSADSAGAHSHNDITRRGVATGTHAHNFNVSGVASPPDGTSASDTIGTGTAGGHSHNVTGTTSSTGGGGSHENRPPFYALAYIQRVA